MHESLGELRNELVEDGILIDDVFHIKKVIAEQEGTPCPDDDERFYLHKQDPILCGVLAFNLLVSMHKIGARIASFMEQSYSPRTSTTLSDKSKTLSMYGP